MDPKNKKYILENIHRKTTKQIAADLHLKERNVKRFLETQNSLKVASPIQEVKKDQPKALVLVFSICLIILVGFVAYANSFKGQFVYDDQIWVKENHAVVGQESFKQMLISNIGEGSDRKYNFYRPITILSLALNYHWAKLDVSVYHLTNVFFHVGVALCIYWLVNILFNQNLIALLTAVFYVAHPIASEAVCYISGRSDSLYVFFLLLAFIFYIKEIRPAIAGIFMVGIFYILGILSKENAVILPFLLLIYHAFFGKFKPLKFGSIAFITIAYGILRATVLYFPSPAESFHSTFIQRIPGFFVAVTNYARLLIWPFHLHMEYGDFLFNWSNGKALLGLLIVIAVVIAVIKTFKENRIVAFGIVWFFVALMPESNLYRINAYMYEHWLYLPSVGFFLVLAHYLNQAYRQQQFKIIAVVMMVVLTCFYTYLTFKQGDYWKDPISFYERTLKYAPFSARLDNNLALLYSAAGRKQEAIVYFKKAIDLNPNYAEPNNNLAVVYADLGQNDKAIEYYQKTLNLGANNAEIDFAGVYSNLGNAYDQIGQRDKAIDAFEKSIQMNPNLASPYNNLALVYQKMGKIKEASQLFEKAAALDNKNVVIKFNLGNSYAALKRNDEAMEQFKQVIQLDGQNAAAYNNVGFLLKLAGRDNEAISYLNRAIELNDKMTESYENLSLIYLKLGNKKQAQSTLGQALIHDPAHADLYNHLLDQVNSK